MNKYVSYFYWTVDFYGGLQFTRVRIHPDLKPARHTASQYAAVSFS